MFDISLISLMLTQTYTHLPINSLGLSSYLKTATLLSQLAVASYFSTKRLKSKPTTNSEWFSNLLSTLCELQSQMWVLISYEVDARMFAWYGENLIFLTASVWPVSVIMGDSIVDLKSQSLIWPSVDEVAMKFSYLLKSHESTSFKCAWILLTSFPALKSQMRTD